MNRAEFDERMKVAVAGHGGVIFEDHYDESLIDADMTLQQIAADLKHDIKIELEDIDSGYEDDERSEMKGWLDMPTGTNEECHQFFSAYLDNDRRCSFPELCGNVVGAMAKVNMFDEAIELIELDQVEDDENGLYWDT